MLEGGVTGLHTLDNSDACPHITDRLKATACTLSNDVNSVLHVTEI